MVICARKDLTVWGERKQFIKQQSESLILYFLSVKLLLQQVEKYYWKREVGESEKRKGENEC